MSADWQFWIDRGGTFTDIVARGPDGGYATRKLLSEAPEHYDDAALQGIRDILGAEADAPIPAERVEAVRMGTTVATNALLERKGERTLLVVTRGLADQLRIGYQNRPRLFDLNIRLPEILYDRVVEADERMGPHGEVVQPLDEEKLEADLARAHGEGFRAVAICLMHGYRHTVHEAAAEAIAHRVGFEQVSVSHKVSPLMKFVSRGDTTVVDAYLSPILRRHVERMAAALGGGAAVVHAVQWRAGGCAPVPGQGRHPFRAGGRHCGRRRDGPVGRFRAHYRLRYGRHLDRCVALCGQL